MNLQDICVSLELAKELKENGFQQESLFYWNHFKSYSPEYKPKWVIMEGIVESGCDNHIAAPNIYWANIPGYRGVYQVSNLGQVRRRGKILKQNKLPNGYLRICLSINDVKKFYSVHRLVASAFCVGEAEGLEVNHLNGNKESNWAENLEWVTKSENTKHAIEHGLVNRTRNEKGQYV